MDYGSLSLAPPLLAIGLALLTRHVYLSLAGGLWLGYSMLHAWSPLSGLGAGIDAIIAVLGKPGDARVIVFTLLIGALIATLEKGGGVRGFIHWVETRRWVNNGRQAQWLAWGLGVIIFIESNITVLVAGSVSRPLFDRYRVAREKLAYIIDSTSAPICILIPLNAWGAFNLGLLDRIPGVAPLPTFLQAIGLNFYALAAVLIAALTITRGINVGPMARAEHRAAQGQVLSDGASPVVDPLILGSLEEGIAPRARNMLLPILALVCFMPLGLYITGDGRLLQGSGSTSVLWSVLFALAVAWGLLLCQRLMNLSQLTHSFLQGAGALVPLALILLLALAMGDLSNRLGTGAYVAGLVSDTLPTALLLPAIFLSASLMAFSIGSSWGTFAIMIPIAVPVAVAGGLPAAPFLAAVLSGGIFGDHASPISDTTVIASMAAATDHIDHVRTQLPYALAGGTLAALCFAITGLVIA